MYESLYGNFTNYGISLVLWGLSSLKTLLQESSLAQAKHVRPTVEFAGRLLRIGRSRKRRHRCWPLIGHKKIQSQTNIRMSRGIGLLRRIIHILQKPNSIIAKYRKGIFSFLMVFILAKVSEEKNRRLTLLTR